MSHYMHYDQCTSATFTTSTITTSNLYFATTSNDHSLYLSVTQKSVPTTEGQTNKNQIDHRFIITSMDAKDNTKQIT